MVYLVKKRGHLVKEWEWRPPHFKRGYIIVPVVGFGWGTEFFLAVSEHVCDPCSNTCRLDHAGTGYNIVLVMRNPKNILRNIHF